MNDGLWHTETKPCLSRRDMMAIEIARIKMQAKMVARGDVNLSLGYGDDRLDVADIVEEADSLIKELDKNEGGAK